MVLPCNGYTSVFVSQVSQSHRLSLWFLLLTLSGLLPVNLLPPGLFHSWLLISTAAFLACLIFLALSLFSAASLPAWTVFYSLGFSANLTVTLPWDFVDPICGHAHTLSISAYYFIAFFPQLACTPLWFVASGNPTCLLSLEFPLCWAAWEISNKDLSHKGLVGPVVKSLDKAE